MWGLPSFPKIFQREWGSQTHHLPLCVSRKGPSDPNFNPWKSWPHESQSWNLALNPQEWWNVLRGRRRAPRGGLSIPGDHPSLWKHPWGPSGLLEPRQASALLPHPLPASSDVLSSSETLPQSSPRSPDGGVFLSLDPTPSDCTWRIPKASFPTTSCSWPSERTVGGVSKGHGERGEDSLESGVGADGNRGAAAGKDARGLGPRGRRVREGYHCCGLQSATVPPGLMVPPGSIPSQLPICPSVSHECWGSSCHTCLKQNLQSWWEWTLPANIYICTERERERE